MYLLESHFKTRWHTDCAVYPRVFITVSFLLPPTPLRSAAACDPPEESAAAPAIGRVIFVFVFRVTIEVGVLLLVFILTLTHLPPWGFQRRQGRWSSLKLSLKARSFACTTHTDILGGLFCGNGTKSETLRKQPPSGRDTNDPHHHHYY